MIYVLTTVHILICLFLILVVLLQQGKGADLSVFGGGSTQAAFGARGAASLLHKLTVWGFIGFIVTTIGIGFIKSEGGSGGRLREVLEEDVDAGELPPAGESVDLTPAVPPPADPGADADTDVLGDEPAPDDEPTP